MAVCLGKPRTCSEQPTAATTAAVTTLEGISHTQQPPIVTNKWMPLILLPCRQLQCNNTMLRDTHLTKALTSSTIYKCRLDASQLLVWRIPERADRSNPQSTRSGMWLSLKINSFHFRNPLGSLLALSSKLSISLCTLSDRWGHLGRQVRTCGTCWYVKSSIDTFGNAQPSHGCTNVSSILSHNSLRPYLDQLLRQQSYQSVR